ncbi:unnamed protein product [Rotaria sordida]|uniref:Uncharacterized protein n=1 Tax=Rotaria sordida TaxID=392033 RepID=A0A815HZE0_9BILA|nr:unnamed protein product [Rotaria sordida]CAF4174347.1 unnamed protein product [Rotaria sordida]
MLSSSSSNNDNDDSNIVDLLYNLCKENELNWYYGHQHMVQLLLEYGALHSIRNSRRFPRRSSPTTDHSI